MIIYCLCICTTAFLCWVVSDILKTTTKMVGIYKKKKDRRKGSRDRPWGGGGEKI